MSEQRFPSLSHWGAFDAVVVNGRLERCEPFALDPDPSPMLGAIPAMVYSPLRIARPAVREGWLAKREASNRALRGRERFVEVSWDTALDLVAGEVARVRAERGAQGIFGGSYGWGSAGRLHHARTLVHRYLYAGGGCVDQIGNYSWGAAQTLLPHVIGSFAPIATAATHWPAIVAHTRLLVAFGGLALKNGQVSHAGAGEHSMRGWLGAARAAGCEFVVVSPTQADCPEFLGAQWIPIRPNTDTALLLALAHGLIAAGRHDRAFLERHCSGFERLRAYVAGESDGVAKSAEWAEPITGIAAATTRELARRLADSPRTLLTAAYSLQRAHHGEQPYWALIALAAMLGQIGLPGGGFGFGHGSMNGIASPRVDSAWPELPAGKNPAGLAIPVARIADMLASPGAEYEFNGERRRYPDIGLIYWAGGNPFHHHQDLNRLRAAWQRPQTVIVQDGWWTASARHADIVLPASTTLERNDVGVTLLERFIFAMHRAIDPIAGARGDYDIFSELAERGGFGPAFTEGRGETQWLRHMYETARAKNAHAGIELPPFDAFWAEGFAEKPRPRKDFVLFADFRADPTQHALNTPSGRIDLYSERIAGFGYDDCPPHPSWLPPDEWLGAGAAARFPLHLVTVQPAARLHSQMDPGPLAQATKLAGREPIRIGPREAEARGIRAGDVVRVFNDRGACLAGAEIDAGLADRVVAMATGAWFDPEDRAGPERHGNPNVLSRDIGTSRLAQGPSALSTLVEVERWAGEAPAVRAHTPPEIVR